MAQHEITLKLGEVAARLNRSVYREVNPNLLNLTKTKPPKGGRVEIKFVNSKGSPYSKLKSSQNDTLDLTGTFYAQTNV